MNEIYIQIHNTITYNDKLLDALDTCVDDEGMDYDRYQLLETELDKTRKRLEFLISLIPTNNKNANIMLKRFIKNIAKREKIMDKVRLHIQKLKTL
jgi:tRNA1(Val) A37 N6-methylase TrmN6